MADFGIGELFLGGLVLLAIGASRALNRLSPEPPKSNQRTLVIRETLTNKEIIRDPAHAQKGVSVICPYCSKVFR